MASHAVSFGPYRFDHQSAGEAGGQLVRCSSGEIELFGHAGEWRIPANHMVYIPPSRLFRIRARVPSSCIVVKFCSEEVSWSHDGCWVGAVDDFAGEMIGRALRWSTEAAASDHRARCFFVALGDMLPEWFRHERIMWTPYAQSCSIQKAIDYARRRGPAVTLSEVADHAGMSERTLRRHMQAELGQSWREFIREMRMNRAMELLRKDDRSITDIAFEVGFSSSSAFSSAFYDYVGETPSKYSKSFSDRATRSICTRRFNSDLCNDASVAQFDRARALL
jgi:AraC-like DNA-binding protein